MDTENVRSISPALSLARFFEFMYGAQSGYVYVATKDPDTDNFEQFFFKWPSQLEGLIEHVIRETNSKEIYYAPVLYSRASGEKADFLGTNFIWVEFDGNAPDSIENIPLPTIKIQSSTQGHEHWYWKLDEFETDAAKLEDIMQRIVYHSGSDFSWAINKILRPPDTIHHESARRTQLIRWDSIPYSPSEFASLPEVPIKLASVDDIKRIPEALEVVSKYEWPTDMYRLFRDKVTKGHRSSALTKLSHFCVELHMTNAEALSILLQADDRWGKYKNRKDQRERLVNIINYCRTKHEIDAIEEELKEPTIKIFSYDEFMAREIKIEWALPGLIHKKGMAVLSGPAGAGKTQFSLRFAERLAKGEKFLKWQAERPMKTISLSLEMSEEELKVFLDTMSFADTPLLRENMLIAPEGQSIKILTKQGQEGLTQALDMYKPDGIIIDSFGAALSDDLNSEKMIFELMEYVNGTIRKEFGAFVWFIHHPRKGQVGNKRPNRLDDLYGNQYIGASLTTGISLWPQAPGSPELDVSCTKLRLAEAFKPFKIRRTPDLDFRIMEGQRTIYDIADVPIIGDLGGSI